MRNTLFCLILSASFVWGQNPNVPLAQNALGTVGFYLNSSSGTVINKIVTFTGNPSKVVTITAGATSGAIGIVAGGAGTTGTATVQISGSSVPCVFDGATTAGHYVGISASVNGDCTDAGATTPSGQSLGTVLSTNAGGGTFKIQMTAASGGGGGAGTIDYQSNGTPIGAIGTLNSVPGTGVICTPSVGGSVGALQCSADIGYLSTQLGINAVNAQTGTTYTIAAGDKSNLITFCNSSATAVTLPQGTGSFAAPFSFEVVNYCAGAVTITPTTSTINNGAATLVLLTGQGAGIITDPGGNYQVIRTNGVQLSPVVPEISNYQITAADFSASAFFTTGTGSPTLTLPAILPPFGTHVSFMNYGAGTVTVARNGNTINGNASGLSIGGNANLHPASATIVSDGSTGYFTTDVVTPPVGTTCSSGQSVSAIAANTAAGTCSNPPTTFCSGSASATAATCTGTPAPASYTGLVGQFQAGATSTGAPFTLNINSLGAKNVWLNGSVTSATNFVTSGVTYSLTYDGTVIQLSGLCPATTGQFLVATSGTTCAGTSDLTDSAGTLTAPNGNFLITKAGSGLSVGGGTLGSNTAIFFNTTATTGSTLVTVQAGAGDTSSTKSLNFLNNLGTSTIDLDAVSGSINSTGAIALTATTNGGVVAFQVSQAGTGRALLLSRGVNGTRPMVNLNNTGGTDTSIAVEIEEANATGIALGVNIDGNIANNINWGVLGNGTMQWGSLGVGDTSLSRDSSGVVDFGTGAQGSKAGSWQATNGTLSGTNQAALYATATNCSNAASPAVCGSAAAGAVAIPTGVNSTLIVNTSAITANSRITLLADDSLTVGAATCNSTLTTLVGGMAVTARTAATSFTISFNGTITANPVCVSYTIEN